MDYSNHLYQCAIQAAWEIWDRGIECSWQAYLKTGDWNIHGKAVAHHNEKLHANLFAMGAAAEQTKEQTQ